MLKNMEVITQAFSLPRFSTRIFILHDFSSGVYTYIPFFQQAPTMAIQGYALKNYAL
jgi:hypothetical protein